SEAEMSRFEERLMIEGELFEMLTMVEDDLIDERLDDHLSPDEREHFDAYFLSTPARRERLELESALRGYAARRVAETKKEVANSGGNSAAKAATDARPSTEATDQTGEDPSPQARVIRPARWWSSPRVYLSLAAAAIILIAIGLVVWPEISYRWDVRRGMAALNKAYTENPISARITGLDMPPPSVTRGAASNAADKRELKRAER